jgi:hypothetical protein
MLSSMSFHRHVASHQGIVASLKRGADSANIDGGNHPHDEEVHLKRQDRLR